MSDRDQFKHTPEPWSFMDSGTWTKCKGPRKLSPIAHVGGYVITTLEHLYKVHATDEDDANFICHAVNCHADMLAALKLVMEATWDDGKQRLTFEELWPLRAGEVQTAIAKAESPTP